MDGVGSWINEVGDDLDEVRNGDGLGQKIVEPMAKLFILFTVVGERGHGDDRNILQKFIVFQLLDDIEP